MRRLLLAMSRLRPRVLLWAERLLVTTGVVTLSWCAFVIGDAAIAQRHARMLLEAPPVSERPVSTRALDTTTAMPALPRVQKILAGAPIAALSIPRVHLSAVVLYGSDARTLRRGPGHVEDTALPGEPGNVVIAGHRDTFFRPLRNIQRGDDIFLRTGEGQFHYRVASLRVVDPRDISVLAPTTEALLTLITCYPFWVLGSAPDRFVVRAIRVGDPSVALPEPLPEPPPAAMPLPEVEGTALRDSGAATAAAADDETLIRRAIERFRQTYNAGPARHHDGRPEDPLTFETCAVSLAGDEATATCGTASPPDGVWTLALRRSEGSWAIGSIQW
jgi:sortase A